MSTPKLPALNLVTLGPTTVGKSTLCGHLTVQQHGNPQRFARFFRKIENESKAAMKYAWIFDYYDERECGYTIQLKRKLITTSRYHITAIDTPGRLDLIEHLIPGVCQADVGLLVVPAPWPDFQHSIESIREHLVIGYALGLRHLIVAVSHMDRVDYAPDPFHRVVQAISPMLHRLGFPEGQITYVPLSAWTGANLTQPAGEMSAWYSGPTLLQALDTLEPPVRQVDKPLRMTQHEIVKIPGIGPVGLCHVLSGRIKVDDNVFLSPWQDQTVTRSLEKEHEVIPNGLAGDILGVSLYAIRRGKRSRRGQVISDWRRDTARPTASFQAHIMVLRHPGRIRVGYAPMLLCYSARVPCRFASLLSTHDRRTGETLERNPASLRPGDCALVELVPLKPLVVEPIDECPGLARFVIRDQRMTVAVGVVQSVVPHPESWRFG
eukprot:gnl/Trimastix_PCT/370.p1 GENE.gnl/Trimastix_PCT/370~~gnl/Trimastix_PCT/370.p1  ORF type:complete len:436 (-),score=53.62 gnl/Trimastix_PCT/370:8-1315(-)